MSKRLAIPKVPAFDDLFVRCQWDPEAEVWYVAESNIPGLSTEADTQKAMTAKLLRMIPELLRLNFPDTAEEDFPLELLYGRTERVKLAAAS